MIVAGDPDHCAALARALTRAGGAVDASVGDLGTAVSATSTWHGTSADAFRASARTRSAVGRDLSAALQAAGRALQAFADDLAAAQQQAAHARFLAGTVGLPLSASGTVPPVQAPLGPFSSAEQQAAAEQRTRSLAEAREDVLRLVADARESERAAHERLLRALSGLGDARRSDDGRYRGPLWPELVDVATGLVKAPQAMKARAVDRAKALRAEARRLLRQADAATGSRKLHLLARRAEVLAELQDARRDVARGAGAVGRVGRVGSAVSRADAFRVGLPVLKHVPVLGTAMTGVGTLYDVHVQDMDPGHAAVKNAAGTLAGMGTAVAVTAVLGGASIAALPVLVAVGAGAFASWGTGAVVEHYGDDVADAARGLWDRIS